VQRRALRRWFAIAGVALAGCIYTEPINRQPKVRPPQRVCDAAHPADPCSADNLHHGDHVMVMAEFDDPDSDPNEATVQWRISACDGTTTSCDANRLYDDTVPAMPPYPEFTVPPALTASGVPVRNIVFEIVVFDDRGASSSAEDSWNVIPDAPAVAQERSAGAGAP
jgi:hypothetical protein